MTDLIFHIGLSKCASSTLQRQIFRHEDGYLGTAPGIQQQDNLAKQLQQCTPLAGRQTTNKRGLSQWTERIRIAHKKHWPQARRLILSNEMLSGASRLSDRPILPVISLIRERFWREGEVKVVLVLRNQAARLASSYVQRSSCRFNPGQADFEQTVKQHLRSRRHLRLFDYSRWVDGLQSIIGRENVCVLLLEESHTMNFWQNLTQFCGLERFEPTSMLSPSTSRNNVRRRSPDRWSISDFDPRYRAKVTADKWLNGLWPAHLQPEQRARLRQQAMAHLEARYRRKYARIKNTQRETEIELTPKLMKEMRAHCGQFNERLSEQLGRNLKTLGYPD